MAKLGEPIKGHEKVKEEAKKEGLRISEKKYGRIISFCAPSKKKEK